MKIHFFSLFLLCSCGVNFGDVKTPTLDNPNDSPTVSFQKFNFEMSERKNISGTWSLLDGRPAKKIRLDIFSENGKDFYKSVLTDEAGRYKTEIQPPSRINSILIKSKYIGAVNSKIIKL